ncbi:MAG TPA: hypothetical protein VLH77_06665, partial [Gammaproteobacteria bacterium]|nr:hypothetical protein [Gammaproteobacteria bacterium]
MQGHFNYQAEQQQDAEELAVLKIKYAAEAYIKLRLGNGKTDLDPSEQAKQDILFNTAYNSVAEEKSLDRIQEKMKGLDLSEGQESSFSNVFYYGLWTNLNEGDAWKVAYLMHIYAAAENYLRLPADEKAAKAKSYTELKNRIQLAVVDLKRDLKKEEDKKYLKLPEGYATTLEALSAESKKKELFKGKERKTPAHFAKYFDFDKYPAAHGVKSQAELHPYLYAVDELRMRAREAVVQEQRKHLVEQGLNQENIQKLSNYKIIQYDKKTRMNFIKSLHSWEEAKKILGGEPLDLQILNERIEALRCEMTYADVEELINHEVGLMIVFSKQHLKTIASFIEVGAEDDKKRKWGWNILQELDHGFLKDHQPLAEAVNEPGFLLWRSYRHGLMKGSLYGYQDTDGYLIVNDLVLQEIATSPADFAREASAAALKVILLDPRAVRLLSNKESNYDALPNLFVKEIHRLNCLGLALQGAAAKGLTMEELGEILKGLQSSDPEAFSTLLNEIPHFFTEWTEDRFREELNKQKEPSWLLWVMLTRAEIVSEMKAEDLGREVRKLIEANLLAPDQIMRLDLRARIAFIESFESWQACKAFLSANDPELFQVRAKAFNYDFDSAQAQHFLENHSEAGCILSFKEATLVEIVNALQNSSKDPKHRKLARKLAGELLRELDEEGFLKDFLDPINEKGYGLWRSYRHRLMEAYLYNYNQEEDGEFKLTKLVRLEIETSPADFSRDASIDVIKVILQDPALVRFLAAAISHADRVKNVIEDELKQRNCLGQCLERAAKSLSLDDLGQILKVLQEKDKEALGLLLNELPRFLQNIENLNEEKLKEALVNQDSKWLRWGMLTQERIVRQMSAETLNHYVQDLDLSELSDNQIKRLNRSARVAFINKFASLEEAKAALGGDERFIAKVQALSYDFTAQEIDLIRDSDAGLVLAFHNEKLIQWICECIQKNAKNPKIRKLGWQIMHELDKENLIIHKEKVNEAGHRLFNLRSYRHLLMVALLYSYQKSDGYALIVTPMIREEITRNRANAAEFFREASWDAIQVILRDAEIVNWLVKNKCLQQNLIHLANRDFAHDITASQLDSLVIKEEEAKDEEIAASQAIMNVLPVFCAAAQKSKEWFFEEKKAEDLPNWRRWVCLTQKNVLTSLSGQELKSLVSTLDLVNLSSEQIKRLDRQAKVAFLRSLPSWQVAKERLGGEDSPHLLAKMAALREGLAASEVLELLEGNEAALIICFSHKMMEKICNYIRDHADQPKVRKIGWNILTELEKGGCLHELYESVNAGGNELIGRSYRHRLMKIVMKYEGKVQDKVVDDFKLKITPLVLLEIGTSPADFSREASAETCKLVLHNHIAIQMLIGGRSRADALRDMRDAALHQAAVAIDSQAGRAAQRGGAGVVGGAAAGAAAGAFLVPIIGAAGGALLGAAAGAIAAKYYHDSKAEEDANKEVLQAPAERNYLGQLLETAAEKGLSVKEVSEILEHLLQAEAVVVEQKQEQLEEGPEPLKPRVAVLRVLPRWFKKCKDFSDKESLEKLAAMYQDQAAEDMGAVVKALRKNPSKDPGKYQVLGDLIFTNADTLNTYLKRRTIPDPTLIA